LNVFKHQKSFSLFKNIPHIPMCGGSERFVCVCVCVDVTRLAKIHYINIKLSSLVNKRINIEANIEYKYLLTLFIFVFYSRSDAEKSTNSKQQCNRTIIHP